MNAKQLAALIEDEMSNHLTIHVTQTAKTNFSQMTCEDEDGCTFNIKITQLDIEEETEAETEPDEDEEEI